MKGKITIVLLSLALVFGMIAASCDNGVFPDADTTYKDASTLVVYKAVQFANTVNALPVNDIGDSPNRFSADELATELKKKSLHKTAANTYVRAYIIGKVAYNPAFHTGDNIAIANKYSGMPILVKNPDAQ